MTLKECYEILRLNPSASLDEIKHAYRRRAFELHPDLNPKVADAAQQFQQLNEAYVILSKIVALREQKTGANQSAECPGPHGPADSHASERPSDRGKENARREKTASEQTTRSEEAKARSCAGNAAQDTAAGAASSSRPETATEKTGFQERKQGAKTGEEVYAEQQEVLKDILNDAFARRVFEDIYSEIRKKTPPKEKAALGNEPQPKTRAVTAESPGLAGLKRLGRDWMRGKKAVDLSKSIGGSLKNWLRGQIDEEQVFELPARRLAPGAKIRLQIRRGLSDEVTTLDVTLPPDFHPDKPIRLKGMGKKLGRWQGDLYLRFSSRD